VVVVRSEVVVGAGCFLDDGEEEPDEPQALMTATSIISPAASPSDPEERPGPRLIRRLTLTKDDAIREVDVTRWGAPEDSLGVTSTRVIALFGLRVL